MKAIILSAGQGSRLLPLTLEMPKCLVTVEGRPILLHQLEALADAGIDEAVVVVGYRHEQVDAFLQGPLPIPARSVFNPFWPVVNAIGSLWVARAELDTPFCLLNGDTVFDGAVLGDALARAPHGIGLVVEPIARPELDDMRVAVEGGQIRAVAKDLPIDRTTHRSLGVVTSKDASGLYRAALERVIARPDGHAAYHHQVVAELAATAGVAAVERRAGHWQEIDRPEDIAAWDATQAASAS